MTPPHPTPAGLLQDSGTCVLLHPQAKDLPADRAASDHDDGVGRIPGDRSTVDVIDPGVAGGDPYGRGVQISPGRLGPPPLLPSPLAPVLPASNGAERACGWALEAKCEPSDTKFTATGAGPGQAGRSGLQLPPAGPRRGQRRARPGCRSGTPPSCGPTCDEVGVGRRRGRGGDGTVAVRAAGVVALACLQVVGGRALLQQGLVVHRGPRGRAPASSGPACFLRPGGDGGGSGDGGVRGSSAL